MSKETELVEQIKELTERVEKLQRSADEATGQLKAHKAEMKKTFGVDTSKAAKALLVRLEKELETTRVQVEREITTITKELDELESN